MLIPKQWDIVIATNIKAALLLTRWALMPTRAHDGGVSHLSVLIVRMMVTASHASYAGPKPELIALNERSGRKSADVM